MAKLNPKKMKVAELKAELEARNVEVGKGLKKADLVAMLMSALESQFKFVLRCICSMLLMVDLVSCKKNKMH